MAAQLSTIKETFPLKIQLDPVITMTDKQFFDFCQLNQDIEIEPNAVGELIFLSPTGAKGDQLRWQAMPDRLNFEIIVQLGIWSTSKME